MGELGGFVVIALLIVLLWYAVQESGKRASREREVANEAIRHISLYLRERTGMGPWFEIDEFYRLHYVDIKCTRCEIDTIFVCNANASRESEFIDVHFSESKLRIMRGHQLLFNDNPLNMMSYEREAYELTKDNPPPQESGAYAAWSNTCRKSMPQEKPQIVLPTEKQVRESYQAWEKGPEALLAWVKKNREEYEATHPKD